MKLSYLGLQTTSSLIVRNVPIVRPLCSVEAPPVVIFALAPDEAPRSLAKTGPVTRETTRSGRVMALAAFDTI